MYYSNIKDIDILNKVKAYATCNLKENSRETCKESKLARFLLNVTSVLNIT